jgi:hypothetical protein
MPDRTTISVQTLVYERLRSHKRAGESWSDFGDRVADLLDDDARDTTDHTQSTRIDPTQAEEIARLAGDRAAEQVENRLTRR